MNRLETWFCSSSLWRYVTKTQVLPWVLSGSDLGDHLLELGAGPGAATGELRLRASRVTSLEYDHGFAASLAACHHNGNGAVLQGDAANLPFADKAFSSAVAILVLHHLRSQELQRRAFAEIYRVLRPGGVFFAVEIQDGWLQRAIHRGSTLVPIEPGSVPARLTGAGFSRVTIDIRGSGFRFRALRPQ
jgi:SAM-dependent methyltransferase